MKNLYFIFLSIFFFIICIKPIYAIDNLDWKKLAKNIYIDNKSITTQNGAKIAWFIEYSQDKYEKTKIKAYCDTKVLEILEFSTLDKNRNLISLEINKYRIGCDYSALFNGKIYFKALCAK